MKLLFYTHKCFLKLIVHPGSSVYRVPECVRSQTKHCVPSYSLHTHCVNYYIQLQLKVQISKTLHSSWPNLPHFASWVLLKGSSSKQKQYCYLIGSHRSPKACHLVYCVLNLSYQKYYVSNYNCNDSLCSISNHNCNRLQIFFSNFGIYDWICTTGYQFCKLLL